MLISQQTLVEALPYSMRAWRVQATVRRQSAQGPRTLKSGKKPLAMPKKKGKTNHQLPISTSDIKVDPDTRGPNSSPGTDSTNARVPEAKAAGLAPKNISASAVTQSPLPSPRTPVTAPSTPHTFAHPSLASPAKSYTFAHPQAAARTLTSPARPVTAIPLSAVWLTNVGGVVLLYFSVLFSLSRLQGFAWSTIDTT